MNVIFFAQGRLAAGQGEAALPVAGPMTQAEFWAALVEKFPALAPIAGTARLARRETYLEPDDVLGPDDEIAVIPPVSGG